MSHNPTRDRVPIYGRPALWIIAAASLVEISVAAVLIVPPSCPGVVELVIGVVWASVLTRPLTRAWIDFVKSGAERTRIANSYWERCQRVQVPELIFGAGVFVAFVSAYILWLNWPGLQSPWARFDSVARDFPVPVRSMFTSAFVYMMAGGLMLCISMVIWYYRLPRDSR